MSSKSSRWFYHYLLRNLTVKYRDHVWGTDITYPHEARVCVPRGIYRLFSRYALSWELSDNLEADFVASALEKALEKPIPEIVNSDQGSQFTSNLYELAESDLNATGLGLRFVVPDLSDYFKVTAKTVSTASGRNGVDVIFTKTILG